MLQGDIDALEQEKVQLTKKLDIQSKKAIHAGIMGPRYSKLLQDIQLSHINHQAIIQLT